jgi:hypothetical protein
MGLLAGPTSCRVPSGKFQSRVGKLRCPKSQRMNHKHAVLNINPPLKADLVDGQPEQMIQSITVLTETLIVAYLSRDSIILSTFNLSPE